jgi:hypothetical protein
MATHSHDIDTFIARAKLRRSLHTPVPCQRCGRELTDPASILRGYGDECAGKIEAERALLAAWPKGTRVRITDGSNEGLTGAVMAVDPQRALARVWLDGRMCAQSVPVAWLERIGGEG